MAWTDNLFGQRNISGSSLRWQKTVQFLAFADTKIPSLSQCLAELFHWLYFQRCRICRTLQDGRFR